MATKIDNFTKEFLLGDHVSFNYYGDRLFGVIARVYNTRYNYHVEVNNERYEVSLDDDLRSE